MQDILRDIESAASKVSKAEEGDFIGDDGRLYCGKCRTPKQARVTILGMEKTYPCLCKCGVEKVRREEELEKKRAFEERVKELRKSGFPEAQMEDWTFDKNDTPDSRYIKIARKYVENWQDMLSDGRGLLLFGDVGTGKTFIASCIINALIDKGVPCMMTNFNRITNTLSGMFEGKQEYIDSLSNFPLICIDDLGAERGTEYVGEIVHNIIDSRYREGLPMIITTNLTAEQLKRPEDVRKKRIYSRLLEMCIPIEVEGTDRRRQKLKEGFGKYKDLLGL